MTAITSGSRVAIVKGCQALSLTKGTIAYVESAQPMGAEYSHMVRVVLRISTGAKHGKAYVLWARHENRLSDATVNLNTGNPLHKVQIQAR